MCGPWALPAALLLGGSGLKFFGERKAANAQMHSYQAERARQQAFTAEQDAAFRDSLDRAGAMANPANEQAAAARRETNLAAVIAPPRGDYLPGSASASPVVHTEADRASAGRAGDSAQLANALARLSGTGDQLLDTNIMNARNAQRIGQVGGFMRGSAQAGEAELEAAAHKGALLRGLGALAQQIGSAMLTGGAGAGMGGAGKAVGAKMAGGGGGGLGALFGMPDVAWNLG